METVIRLPQCTGCKEKYNKSSIKKALFTQCGFIFCEECFKNSSWKCRYGCKKEQGGHSLCLLPIMEFSLNFSNYFCKTCGLTKLDLDHNCSYS